MRILHVITGMQKAAGTSVFAGEVCNTLVEMGHEVSLLVKYLGEDGYPVGERVEVISPSPTEDLDSILRLRLTSSTVVHIHALWSPWLTKVARAARKAGCKVVWSPHGMLTPWAMHNKRMKKLLGWWLYQRAALRHADLLHATAQSEVEDIRRMGLKNPVVVAPLGVRIQKSKSRVEVEQRTEKVLLFVSRVQRKKGLPNLLEAWARVRNDSRVEKEKWRLRIVGPDQDNHTAELREQAERLSITGVVQFAGPKYDADLTREYANADLFVLPTHSENFGSVVIESLAQGVPVICTKGAPWEELETYKCGWWIDIGVEPLVKALIEACGHAGRVTLPEMGRRGRKLVEEKYTWQAVTKTILEAYGKLV